MHIILIANRGWYSKRRTLFAESINMYLFSEQKNCSNYWGVANCKNYKISLVRMKARCTRRCRPAWGTGRQCAISHWWESSQSRSCGRVKRARENIVSSSRGERSHGWTDNLKNNKNSKVKLSHICKSHSCMHLTLNLKSLESSSLSLSLYFSYSLSLHAHSILEPRRDGGEWTRKPLNRMHKQ